MRHVLKRRSVKFAGLTSLLGILGICGAVGLVAAAGSSEAAAPAPGVLKSVSPAVLEGGKLHLTAPDALQSARARVGQATAEDVARRHAAGQVIETALALVDDQLSQPPMTCFCWVVASEPPGGVYIHQPLPRSGQPLVRFVPTQTYHIDLIDAVTGEWLYAAEGAHGADQIVK